MDAAATRRQAQQLAACDFAALAARLREDADARRCPVLRYTFGCRCFDRNLLALGVQQFMIAHHRAASLQSAALLTFAGLAVIGAERPSSLFDTLLSVWAEYGRPEIGAHPVERALLSALGASPQAASGADASPADRARQMLNALPIDSLAQEARELDTDTLAARVAAAESACVWASIAAAPAAAIEEPAD